MLTECGENHGFCKPCWQEYFEKAITVVQKCDNLKCPYDNCDKYATNDDV